jgi:hypothetical protein
MNLPTIGSLIDGNRGKDPLVSVVGMPNMVPEIFNNTDEDLGYSTF